MGSALQTRFTQTLAFILGCGSLSLCALSIRSNAIAAELNSTVPPNISLYRSPADASQPSPGSVIFEQRGDILVGAFYFPLSEYTCFTGRQTEQGLQVLSLPTQQDPINSFELSLQDMTRASAINTSELQTLAACRQDVVAFLKQNQTAMDTLIPRRQVVQPLQKPM